MSNSTSPQPRPALEPGTKVEVRTGFDRTWVNGYEIHAVTQDGYSVKRRSDDEILPAVFAHDDVRRERRNSMWWY
ncbi:MAG: hypothetical protein KDA95_05355 [Acidimicrobiales bacterium]|nr:hypothetical protein [Acidimicrobiales bacterium]